jgi:hypothetical protein
LREGVRKDGGRPAQGQWASEWANNHAKGKHNGDVASVEVTVLRHDKVAGRGNVAVDNGRRKR